MVCVSFWGGGGEGGGGSPSCPSRLLCVCVFLSSALLFECVVSLGVLVAGLSTCSICTRQYLLSLLFNIIYYYYYYFARTLLSLAKQTRRL